jgi:hypothetical protein
MKKKDELEATIQNHNGPGWAGKTWAQLVGMGRLGWV